jgi:hypothetical protein
VARVHHQAGAAETAALATAVRGPGRLAIENSRLAVQVICEAEELEASRRRIVTQADVERRRLERDLHDSAQQHVLALGLALRSALDRATDDETRDVLHRSVASTYQVLDELRDLSHGFYPASLEQTGLSNALDGIIDRAPVPVSVIGIPPGRLPAQVERAIYLLMARITASARHPLTADIRREHDRVVIDIGGTLLTDGVLADVFAVLGGTLTFEEGSDPTVHGELPIETVPEDA